MLYLMPMESKPKVVPKKEHRISRKQMSGNALRILYRLNSRGFIAYLVGGCVRDLMLGRTPKDFDIGTNATPGQIKKLFHNCRLVGRRFRLAHIRFQDEIIEVSTFRRAGEDTDIEEIPEVEHGRRRHVGHLKDEHGMVLADNIFGSPEEDALRRDFTINALAYNIADSSVVDFSTGLADLKERLIRCIGDPSVRFTEDPVRMLRAIRFAASHNLEIEDGVWQAILKLSPIISRVSPSRLYEEVQKLFLLGFAAPTLFLLEKSGLLVSLFPGLADRIHTEPGLFQTLEKNLRSIDELVESGASLSPALFLTALFGESIEKEASRRHQDGIPRRQALDVSCAAFLEEIEKTAHIPGRAATRLCSILALKSSICKMPPRRPGTVAGRPEFPETLVYLSIIARSHNEYNDILRWWEAFISENPIAAEAKELSDETPRKKRRRRRRKSHRAKQGQPDKQS
ncbi:MAG: poly(A) polymerase [Deltaproteobacteria bacterium]|nr:poly(A) polymerase [Deltaproteobacteria bacterium]